MNKKYLLAVPLLFLVFLVLPRAGFAQFNDVDACNDMCALGCQQDAGDLAAECETNCQANMCSGGAYATSSGSSIQQFVDHNYGTDIVIEDGTEIDLSGGNYLVPQCVITDPKTCGLCDLVQFVVDATQFLAGAVAGLALLMFVIGGFYWIFSAGNEQRVTTGKKIMVGSITGVVIVFLAWIIVNTLVLGLSVGGEGWSEEDSAKLFPSANPVDWFQVECVQYQQ